MDSDLKAMNRASRRHGIWTGVGFVLALLGIAVGLGLAWALVSGLRSAAAETQEQDREAREAKVSSQFRSQAQDTVNAILAERDSLPKGKRAYLAAKKAATAKVEQLSSAASTEHETRIYYAIESPKGMFETCSDFVYDFAHLFTAAHCVSQLPSDQIQQALAK